jgi:hypothetical protein
MLWLSRVHGEFLCRRITFQTTSGPAQKRECTLYYAKVRQGLIGMLSLYPKNVKENIPVDVLRKIRKEVEDGYKGS